MPGKIVRSDIDEVRARVNIADVVGQYVTLKSAGIDSLKGLCPFHDERSPSFHVRPQLGYYHCFGCSEGGDVFTFLQKMEHMSFSEAVEELAARIGYQLHYEGGVQQHERSQRARLLEANQAAREFYAAQLVGKEARPARELLVRRKFGRDAAEQFALGYAPRGWQGLADHLKHKGFTEAELLAAGLLTQGSRGAYDRFRGRLIWPIEDVTGRTIGFGARKVYEDDDGPKYLNTPETELYHKSKVLYGLRQARRDIARQRQVVVVEGYTDVMACHLAGVTTAVATCGTAFGPGHIEVIRRILGDDRSQPAEVIFTFDPDEAGQKAALRAFAEERRFVAQTYAAVAPDGLDPSDLRQQRGDAAIGAMIAAKTPLFEFAMRHVVSRYDLESVEGRLAALQQAAPIVASIRNPGLRPGYTRVLASMVGVPLSDAQQAVRAAAGQGRELNGVRVGAASPADMPAGETAPVLTLANSVPRDAHSQRERQALEVMLQIPQSCPQELLDQVLHIPFRTPALRPVQVALAGADLTGTPAARLEATGQTVPASHRGLVSELAVAPLPIDSDADAARYAVDVLSRFLIDDLDAQANQMMGRLQRLSPAADPQGYREVQQALVDIEARRRRLQQSIE